MNFKEFQDSQNFVKNTFTITLGKDYNTYNDVLNYSAQDEAFGQNGVPAVSPILQGSLSSASDSSSTPTYMTRSKCRDTSIGGNDAFNCYYQFNENDDVGHPFFRTDPNDEYSGMGRVYSENIDDNQQVMWISFGIPYFSDVASFYANAVQTDLAQLMNGGSNNLVKTIGEFLGSTITTFLLLPAIPLVYFARALNNINAVSITKYYEFQPSMDVYYRCVQSILAHLAVNIGLANDGYFIAGQIPGAGAVANSPVANQSVQERAAADSGGKDTSGLPDVFSVYGYDIYKINLKRLKFQNSNQNAIDQLAGTDAQIKTNVLLAPNDSSKNTFYDNMISSFSGTIHDASLYIGFRVEKTTDTSESLSNQTGESSVAQAINSKAEAARDARFGLAGVTSALSDIPVLGSIISGLGGAAAGAAGVLGRVTGTGGVADILMGNALIDIPEIWKNSTFSKSYNFTFELRSPYGDPVSIMQSIYIPFALILAGSLSRAAGQASYTAPFICRAYCKGMFAIPLGMIDNMLFKRGDAQFGWNHQILPTCIDVSFSIKDLSPNMYLGIADDTPSIASVFGSNSSFQEYLMTLSGMGLQERQRWFLNVRRRAQILLTIAKETKLSPYYWGTAIGNSFVGRVISNFVPSNRLPLN